MARSTDKKMTDNNSAVVPSVSTEETKVKTNKYAYVTLVMINDTYIGTACVMAASLRKMKAKADLVCLVTNDVSSSGVDTLKLIFDEVIEVDYIKGETRQLSKKQEFIYGGWKNCSFTKWRCLELEQYEKVIFIDADIVVLENIDSLFSLNTPASCFSTPWAYPYTNPGITNPYYHNGKEMSHGSLVKRDDITKAFTSSFVLNGGLVLLKPNKEHLKHMLNILTDERIYGHKGCISMFDEQLLTELYYDLKINWYHISQEYNWFVGKNNWLLRGMKEKVCHYYGQKPWTWSRDAWPDLKIWWDYADQLVEERKELKKFFTEPAKSTTHNKK